MVTEIDTTVPTRVGDLGAIIRIPDAGSPLPGVVLVDGSGDGDRHDWGGWPEWIGDAGAVVLRHDKPGCGGSPGNWADQSLDDRAAETLAAVRVLCDHPAVAGGPVGLYGISQGGWVALIAAVTGGPAVNFVICHSGPGVSVAAQERYRLARELRESGVTGSDFDDALAWVDERSARVAAGDHPEQLLADQTRLADRAWFSTVTAYAYDDVEKLRFLGRILGFDPATVLPRVPCPVLALFGADDTLVPIADSVVAFADHLPDFDSGKHGLAVFPGANHGLFTADPDPAIPRQDQLGAGYLATVAGFLNRHATT